MTPTRLTLGTVQLGMRYGVANRTGQPSAADARAILERALELGVRSFDTAPAYGDAEALVGEVLRGREVYLTSKLPSLTRAKVRPEDVALAVDTAVERSLARLGRIDAYLLHDSGDLRSHGARLADAVLAHVRAGRIGRAGLSVYGPSDAALMHEYPGFSAIQFPFSLLDQRMLPELPRLRARGVTTFARSVFLQGLYQLPLDKLPRHLAPTHPWLRALTELCAMHNTTPREAALPFAADADGIDSVVLGVDTLGQLEANVADFARPLPGGARFAAAMRQHFTVVPVEVIDPSRWAPEPAEVRR